MEQLQGLPFVRLKLDKDGEPENADGALVPHGVSDLIVISHGWQNTEDHAMALYGGLLAHMRAAAGGDFEAEGRRFGVVGVFWPALRFRGDLTIVPDDLGVAGGAGGAAAAGNADVAASDLEAQALQVAKDLELADPAGFAARARTAAGGGGAADSFVEELRSELSAAPDEEAAADHEDLLSAIAGRDLVELLRQGGSFAGASFSTAAADEAAGGAAGLGGLVRSGFRMLSGGRAAIASVLNQATYFEMKARAGKVGAGVARLLDAHGLEGVRVHLVGHSFGARVVTSAAAAMQQIRPASLSLLQGAFSHNGFGREVGPRRISGAFRRVVEDQRVSGPILVTHTHRDWAVGLLYAVASTASGEIASSFGVERLIGGPKDLHGGIGANGAQAMPPHEVVAHVGSAGAVPTLVAGKVNNVLSDAIVKDHNDVANAEVGALVWKAVSG